MENNTGGKRAMEDDKSKTVGSSGKLWREKFKKKV